jgi:Uma2 family endonuclease
MIARDGNVYYSVEDFMRIPEETPVELIGGRLVHEPTPTIYHQRISFVLCIKLGIYVEERRLGLVFAAPTGVHLTIIDTYEPDICFIAEEHRGILGDALINGAPDMVIEILSPSNTRKEMRRKMEIYESTGVREYWIVDPKKKVVDCFTSIEGKFDLAAHVDIDGIVRSTVIEGFEVEARTIFDVL